MGKFQITESYKKQKIKYSEFINSYEDVIDKIFYKSSNQLLTLKLDKLRVAITDSPSLFYRFENNKFRVNYKVFIPNETAFDIYENDKLYC